MSPDTAELLRMGELAEASGVPAPTIKHYLREGLLPEPVKTSRNMRLRSRWAGRRSRYSPRWWAASCSPRS